MGRKKIEKCIRPLDYDKYFKPAGIYFSELDTTELLPEEFEALRLCDHDGLNQIEASKKMKVSRATIQRLLKSARFKVSDALLNNRAIKIDRE